MVLFESDSIDVVERTTRKGASQSRNHNVSSRTWYIGRVQRIRKKDVIGCLITIMTLIFWIGLKVLSFNVVGTIE